MAVVAVVVILLVSVAVVMGVLWARKRNLLGAKSSSNGRISFENPSYIREQNGDSVQVSMCVCESVVVVCMKMGRQLIRLKASWFLFSCASVSHRLDNCFFSFSS